MGTLLHLRERIATHLAARRKGSRKKIAEFAREYGFHLNFYKQGLCAVFEKEPECEASQSIAK